MRTALVAFVVNGFLALNIGLVAGGRAVAWFGAGELAFFLLSAVIGYALSKQKKAAPPATSPSLAELRAALKKVEKTRVS